MNTSTTEENRALDQAKAQWENIREMVADLNTDDYQEEEAARQRIQEDALDVSVRSDWYHPSEAEKVTPSEYMILLCTGGPAVKIVGNLNQYGEPEDGWLEHQDWYKPWTKVTAHDIGTTLAEYEEILTRYAQQFYFGA